MINDEHVGMQKVNEPVELVFLISFPISIRNAGRSSLLQIFPITFNDDHIYRHVHSNLYITD